MKRILCLTLVLLVLVVPVFAAGQSHYIYDDTETLTDDEIASLEALASAVYQATGTEVFFHMTADGAVNRPQEVYESIAGDANGILMLVNTANETEDLWFAGLSKELISVEDAHDLFDAYWSLDSLYSSVAAYLLTAQEKLLGTVTMPTPVYAARMADEAQLLTASDRERINSLLDDVSQKHGVDVAAVLVDSANGMDTAAFARAYYNGHGYSRSCVLFLLNMENRDWVLLREGSAEAAFTDSGVDYLFEQLRGSLRQDDFASAMQTYAQLCDEFLGAAEKGEVFDPASARSGVGFGWVVASVVVGLLAAAIGTGAMKGELKTVASKSGASSYVVDDSLNLLVSHETFLRKEVTRREIPKQQENNAGNAKGGKF